MADVTGKIVFFYDDDAYVEPLGQPSQEAVKNSTALMGRQVAGCEFLDAYLTHGSWTELVALVREPSQADSLFRFCEAHPSSRAKRRSLRVIEEGHFHQFFFPAPPASLHVLHVLPRVANQHLPLPQIATQHHDLLGGPERGGQ